MIPAGEITMGASASTSKMRWGRNIEPAWVFDIFVDAPIAAGQTLGGINLQPNQVGYLYGYEIATTAPTPTTLILAWAETRSPTTWGNTYVTVDGVGTVHAEQQSPLVTFYPAYDPTSGTPYASCAFVSAYAEAHPVIRWPVFYQVGFLYAVEEVA